MLQFGLNADVPRQFSQNVPQFGTVMFQAQAEVPITALFQLTREISFLLSFPFSVSLLSLSLSYPPARPDLTTHGQVGLRW